MPIQSALAQVGVAKQASKGSAAANPTFAHGLTNGAVITAEVSQDAEERTSSVRAATGVNRMSVVPGIDFTARAHPKSVGMYAFAALGTDTPTGAGPYTHAITLADSLPYLTMFGKLGANIYKVQDVKIDSLGFSWSGTDPLEMAVSGTGTSITYTGATFVPTTDETIGTDAVYYAASAGTFQLDTVSATPVTASIVGGEITIGNNLEPIMLSGAITPNDIFEGRQDLECTFDLVIDDLNYWRSVLTGSTGGTTATAAPAYGSFSIAFTSGTNSLTLAATKVAFTTDFPDADPAGGPVQVTLAGVIVRPSSGSPLTITAVNSQATY